MNRQPEKKFRVVESEMFKQQANRLREDTTDYPRLDDALRAVYYSLEVNAASYQPVPSGFGMRRVKVSTIGNQRGFRVWFQLDEAEGVVLLEGITPFELGQLWDSN